MDVISDPINLCDENLLEWVSQPHKKGDTLDLFAEQSLFDARGLAREVRIDLPGPIGEMHTITGIRRQYRVERFGQPVSDCFVMIPQRTTLSASAKAFLGVQKKLKLDDAARQAIVEAFTNYLPAKHGAAAAYMATRVTDYNRDHPPGLNGGEFNLFLDLSYEWMAVQQKLDEDEWLHRVFEHDASTSLPELCPTEGQHLGDDGYRLIFIGDEYLHAVPPPHNSKNVIPIEQGKLVDNDLVEDAVKKRAKELSEAGNRDCDFLETQSIRITSVKALDETRWDLDWVYLEGKGCGFHMLMPVLKTRRLSKVLYATVRWAEPEDALKKIFIDSARDAAKLAAVVAIVASSFNEGLAIFKAAFWRLIKERALQTYQCLIPELLLVNEYGPWEIAGWPDPVEPDPTT